MTDDPRLQTSLTRKPEQAGVHVAYGLVGLKTHCRPASWWSGATATLSLPRFSGHFRTRFYVETEEGHHGNEEVSAGAAGTCGAVVSGVGSEAGAPAAGRAVERAPGGLRNWIRQAEVDPGERDDRPSTAMMEENRRLAREVAELRRVNEVLRAASAYFAAEIDPTRRRS
nr:hypothetical protein [Rhodococcus sp. LB1]